MPTLCSSWSHAIIPTPCPSWSLCRHPHPIPVLELYHHAHPVPILELVPWDPCVVLSTNAHGDRQKSPREGDSDLGCPLLLQQ